VTESPSDSDRQAMLSAAEMLGLDPQGAVLVSASSRLIWHLPTPNVAVTISRCGMKSLASVTAETAAIRAATAAGVRTPRLRGGPLVLANDRFALATDWLAGRTPTAVDWPAITAAAAQLTKASPVDVPILAWPTADAAPNIAEFLGEPLAEEFAQRCIAAARSIESLLEGDALVLAHGDLQPANVLCDADGQAWLLDMEYARLAPREWDPAKIAILARRFGDPPDSTKLLSAWAGLDARRLARCIAAQEALLVFWLVRMAARGTAGAALESRHRAATLEQPDARWGHLG